MATIMHLTTLHTRSDPRIFIKEARSLASHLPHKVLLMVADGKGNIDEKVNRVSVHDLGHLSRNRFVHALVGPWRAFFAICKIKPTIVHFHDPGLIPLGMLLKVFGYKVIYDVHEDVPRQTLGKHWIPKSIRYPISLAMGVLEWFCARTCDALISATPKIAQRFPASKTITVQNFPIITELLNPAPIPYFDRPQSFAYVGAIATIRGAVEMIRAIDLLSNIPGVRVDLAGSFSPASLAGTLKALPGWTSVHYYGQISREQIANLLGNTRAGLVTLHATVNYLDSYPIKMFEYMSVGLPIIASDFPLWRRIIDGVGCGLLVDPLNPKSIAKAMRWILDNPAEAEAMGQRGRQAIERIYNWDDEATKIICLYNKLLTS